LKEPHDASRRICHQVLPLRNIGAAISPFNAWLILQGIETLALRVDRISDNTLAVAQHLKTHAKVAWVNYAGRARPGRGQRRHGAPVGRHRTHRRPAGRPGPGAGGGLMG